ncbi:response regulator [Flavobacterium sp. NST-5]|uniref:histidine kinase n=1 Tax=Flavobacterium ichthyis TaxID=2698827 RepID=A0ABW9ZAL1_9FLAO|nr:response regulator [Flavobacterium ichthyis]NBL65724.1 response regulator [Flavobacterium ichthyis]
MDTNFKRNLIIGFGFSFSLLLVSSVASFVSIKSLLNSNKWVNHTQEVIYNLNSASSTMVDAQTSIRGYMLTGKSIFLQPYLNAEETSNSYIQKLEELTGDNDIQQQQIEKLKTLKSNLFQYLNDRKNERQTGKIIFEDDVLRGREIMKSIRETLDLMESQERQLLNERMSNSKNYGMYSMILIIIAALISLLTTLFYFSRILKDYSERSKLYLELKNKDLETRERIELISGIAAQISAGNYSIRTNEANDDTLGEMGVSINAMASSLENSFTTLVENDWLQAGISELSQAMLGEKNIEELSKNIVDYVANYVQADAAVLYVLEGNEFMETAGYNFVSAKERKFFKMGEGLAGQAATSKKVMELKEIPAENFLISFAHGKVYPKHIIAIPLLDNNVEGVLEIAAIRNFSTTEKKYFNAIANNIGIALKSAQNRKRLQELLEETQAQSEELRAQHTELEQMNAELETQTEKLQASEEELRVQQEELQQTNEELAERSTLLEERNLEIQKKSEDLELSTKYKSEFLANMSHELRTPLNSILLLSRLLSENNEKNLTEEQTEFAKVIQSSGRGLLGLIDEILDLSKIEAGKMDLEFLETPVSEITHSMQDLFSEVAKEKGIQFIIDDKNAPLVIKTDKMRLEQILKNLISNAIKFTSEGSVTLQIEKHNSNEKAVVFTVKDTGIGIPREKQPLIFEAFQQADGSTKRKYGGTGLGLSISRELTKLLKGEISLKSIVNHGSEFTLTLPIYGNPIVVQDKPAEKPSAEINKEVELPQYLSTHIPKEIDDDRNNISDRDKIILIVEDDINFAKSLLEFTRKKGYKGIVCVRGDYALNFALAHKPVGILLDIELPMKNGWQVMDDLKNNPITKPIPVHIMSSHQLKQESLLKGAVNFLDKPVAFEKIPEIFHKIEKIVNRESQKVLIVEDNQKHAKALAFFLENYNINSEIKSEIHDGINALKSDNVDCVILDMGVPDKYSYEILENIKDNPGLENLPVIVFTGKSLSMKEELKLKKYADSIVVKTANSYQRMLDEVSLFLHLVEENKSVTPKKEFKKHQNLNNILSGKTVLVVDDDVRNIYSLTKSLEALKMSVVTAIDGNEALSALQENPEIDVVLLDMMMPNLDGYETATKIRENKNFRDLPVIAVTAKAMMGDREKCINAGASDYITKPVDIDQLLSLLRVWLYDKN